MWDHDRLRPARRSAREEQQSQLGLALARLQPGLDPSLRLQETLLDEFADSDMAVTGHAVKEDDAIVADACLAGSLETDGEGVGMYKKNGGLRGLNLVDELVRGV